MLRELFFFFLITLLLNCLFPVFFFSLISHIDNEVSIYPTVCIYPALSFKKMSYAFGDFFFWGGGVSRWFLFLLNTGLLNDPLGHKNSLSHYRAVEGETGKSDQCLLPVVFRPPHSLHWGSCPPGQEVTQTPPSPWAQTQKEVQGEGLYSR